LLEQLFVDLEQQTPYVQLTPRVHTFVGAWAVTVAKIILGQKTKNYFIDMKEMKTKNCFVDLKELKRMLKNLNMFWEPTYFYAETLI
jgi:hypothetical protein